MFSLCSLPNKQKSSESSAVAMNSTLGSNLSELDRLLLELNAVQHSTPAFPTEGTQNDSLSIYIIKFPLYLNDVALSLFSIALDECTSLSHRNRIEHFSLVIEEAAPPLPSSSIIHQNGVLTPGKAAPPALEKPKRSAAARGIEDVRPSVESLLDELESSVPSPM